MKRESVKIPLDTDQATKAGPIEQVALTDDTGWLREITACKQGVWKEFTVRDTSKYNTLSNDCNQLPNAVVTDLSLGNARKKKCLSKYTCAPTAVCQQGRFLKPVIMRFSDSTRDRIDERERETGTRRQETAIQIFNKGDRASTIDHL